MTADGAERIVELRGPGATMSFGGHVARDLRRGELVALEGDLGAGKTTLVRGALRALGHDGAVPSPTFTIVQQYETANGVLFHFDLYRIASPEELIEIGFEEALADGAVFAEWPGILGGVMPADRLEITLVDGDDGDVRTARLRGFGRWADLIGSLAP
jgi:tRNA threonylcarbamoyl adenosine modification protein YjeE